VKNLFCAAFLMALLAGGAAAQDKPAAKGKPAAKEEPVLQDKVLNGDAKCTRCHDENDDFPVLLIGQTRHGVRTDKRTPTCTSCHGPSESHLNKPADGPRGRPDVTFSKASKVPMEARSQVCLSCHQGAARMDWQMSAHANRDVACSSCHQVHAARDLVRDKLTQPDTCYTCHKEQRAQMNRPVHHPVVEGKMSCASCHNVHGGNPKQLVRDTVNETCFTCHMEKRGPFVHNHPPVQEDCAICHQAHGTTIASLLKARPPFLCQECHSHSSHPSQAGALPNGRTTGTSALGSVGRGCMTCHTNIHGSNSTQNSATSGRFRR
jgi:DmsE family decaheme c-type cytochrome